MPDFYVCCFSISSYVLYLETRYNFSFFFLPPYNHQRFFIRPGLQVDGWKWEACIKPFRDGPWKFSIHHFRWWDWFSVRSTWRRKRERSFKTYQNGASCADAGVKLFPNWTLFIIQFSQKLLFSLLFLFFNFRVLDTVMIKYSCLQQPIHLMLLIRCGLVLYYTFLASLENYCSILPCWFQAIRRRFDKRIYIPLPEAKARQHMFKVLNFPLSSSSTS